MFIYLTTDKKQITVTITIRRTYIEILKYTKLKSMVVIQYRYNTLSLIQYK